MSVTKDNLPFFQNLYAILVSFRYDDEQLFPIRTIREFLELINNGYPELSILLNSITKLSNYHNCGRITNMSIKFIPEFPNLTELILCNLSKLVEIHCINIKKLYMHDCKSFKNFTKMDKLEILILSDCQGITMLPDAKNMVYLRINNVPGIRHIPFYTKLTNIEITNCPIFENNGINNLDDYYNYFLHDADSIRDYSEPEPESESEWESESEPESESEWESDFDFGRRVKRIYKRRKSNRPTKAR
jgi:hypothetical protein